MINYIEKFLLVIFNDETKSARAGVAVFFSFLCFRFPFASVRNLFGVESWTCSRKGMFAAPAVPKQLHRLGTTVS